LDENCLAAVSTLPLGPCHFSVLRTLYQLQILELFSENRPGINKYICDWGAVDLDCDRTPIVPARLKTVLDDCIASFVKKSEALTRCRVEQLGCVVAFHILRENCLWAGREGKYSRSGIGSGGLIREKADTTLRSGLEGERLEIFLEEGEILEVNLPLLLIRSFCDSNP
jgi:hypothetical protein